MTYNIPKNVMRMKQMIGIHGRMKIRMMLLFSVAILSIFLCSCTSKRTTQIKGSTEVISDNKIWMSYDMFDGDRGYEVNIDEESTIHVKIDTDAGELDVKIAADGQTPVYSGRIRDNQVFSVNVAPGDYQIYLNAQNHSGKYSFEITEK